MSWGDHHPAEFPSGGVPALEGAIGALLGIPIHYYATVDLRGFVKMVDAVGGVDINVTKSLSDPNYGGFGVGPGWSIEPGLHHLDGANALAYARIRKSTGESDFTRAARQQEVLVALRNRAVGAGILLSLPQLLSAVGGAIRTDLPADRLPELAALAEQIDGSSTTKVVLGGPMIKSGGSSRTARSSCPFRHGSRQWPGSSSGRRARAPSGRSRAARLHRRPRARPSPAAALSRRAGRPGAGARTGRAVVARPRTPRAGCRGRGRRGAAGGGARR